MFTSADRARFVLLLTAFAIGSSQSGADGAEPEKAANAIPALPALAADATPLRKVQHEQAREGLAYINRCRDLIKQDVAVPSDFRRYYEVLTETCRLGSEFEDKPANRVRWYEARVRLLKEAEVVIERIVNAGSAASQELNLIRFQRLGAEADLLKLKAEVEKGGK